MATTLLNMPPPPSSISNDTGSDPGTPASGISTLSTVAIKDGHEGHHPNMSSEGAAERVARLGGIGPPPGFEAPTSAPYQGRTYPPVSRDYFNPEEVMVPHTPGTSSSIASTDGLSTPEGPDSTNLKRETMAAAFARRQRDPFDPSSNPQNSNVSSNLPPLPPSQIQVNIIAPAPSPLPRSSNASGPLDVPGGYGGMTNGVGVDGVARNTDSPASTQTTASVADAKTNAKMIDGMTYDDGDTTAEGVSLERRDTLRPGQFAQLEGFRDEDTKMED